MKLAPLNTQAWHVAPATSGTAQLRATRAPQGRFHHNAQIAIYTSCSRQGALNAVKRYLSDGRPRVIFPVSIDAKQVADARNHDKASVKWDDYSMRGLHSPSWDLSDHARALGADAMLYCSRTKPELEHIVIFAPHILRIGGPCEPLGV